MNAHYDMLTRQMEMWCIQAKTIYDMEDNKLKRRMSTTTPILSS